MRIQLSDFSITQVWIHPASSETLELHFLLLLPVYLRRFVGLEASKPNCHFHMSLKINLLSLLRLPPLPLPRHMDLNGGITEDLGWMMSQGTGRITFPARAEHCGNSHPTPDRLNQLHDEGQRHKAAAWENISVVMTLSLESCDPVGASPYGCFQTDSCKRRRQFRLNQPLILSSN